MNEEQDEIQKAIFRCFHCGGELVWDNDFATEDMGYVEEGTGHDLHCGSCGAIVRYLVFDENPFLEKGET